MYYRIKELIFDRVVKLDPEETEGLSPREQRLLVVDIYLEELAEACEVLRRRPKEELLGFVEAEGETYREVAP